MTTEPYDLQDVLDNVMLVEAQPNHGALLRWIKRYPQFAKELESFFATWSESEMWKNLPDPVEIDEEAINERVTKRILAKLRTHQRTR